MENKEIKQWVLDNPKLVKMRESKNFPGFFVLKYDRRVFYDNLWYKSPLLLDMRGTVVDEDFNPIIMPFRKIFNQYENDTNIDRDEQVLAVKKINGFMGAVTTYEGEIYFSTTGSMDSDFVRYIKDMLPDMWKDKPKNYSNITWLFEIVHPEDPHVISEKPGAYLIGCRIPQWNFNNIRFRNSVEHQEFLDKVAEESGVLRPEWKLIRFSDLCKEVKECYHEGYVVYGDQTALKLKSPYYKITKLFGRMSLEKLSKILDNPKTSKQHFDEEYYPLIDYLIKNKNSFKAMNEQMKFKFIREFLNR